MHIRGKISGRLGAKDSLVASDSCLPRCKLLTMTNQQRPSCVWEAGARSPCGLARPAQTASSLEIFEMKFHRHCTASVLNILF